MFIQVLTAILLLGGMLPAFDVTAAPLLKTGDRDYLVHVWQTDDGLPQNWVSSIAQTPDGYLWIGTRYGGLARFDGVRFVPFNPQNTPALRDVQVEHLSVDETGRLWVVMGNESITAAQADQFTLYRWPRSQPRLRAAQVLFTRSNHVVFAGEGSFLAVLNEPFGTNGWFLQEPGGPFNIEPRNVVTDHDKSVWATTLNLRLVRLVDGKLELANQLPGLIEPRTTTLAVDSARRLWVASPRRLLSWNGKTFADRTPTNGPPPRDILQIAFTGDDSLWVLESSRLRKIINGQWAVTAEETALPSDSPVRQIQMHGDAQGGVWLVRYGHGLTHVKSDGTSHQLTEADGLPSLFINTWFQDGEGNVWIGTANGLVRIRESGFMSLTKAQGLPGKSVRSVATDSSGSTWIGTVSGGMARWRNGVLTNIPLPTPAVPPVESVTVTPDLTGRLWIGSLNHGLMKMEAGQIERVNTPSSLGAPIRTLFVDSKNQLWIGGLVNLFRYAEGQFRQFSVGEGFVDGHAIGAMAEAADGTLWIGTGPGDLWCYAKEQFEKFTPPDAWPSVRISAVLPDTNGVVWVGTLGGGLLRFHNGKFTRCTSEDGLPDNNITQLLDSADGHLWAGTYAGIFRAHKTELERAAAGELAQVACRVYGRYDGLPALECSSGFQPACWRTAEGRLWFSTANGVVSVNPSEVFVNRQPPVVLIEEMAVDGKLRKLAKPAGRTNADARLEIEPGRHYVEFRFTGLNFAAPDGVRFRARLEPGNTDWQDLGGQRSIGYGPLPPGDYRLQVTACNNEGVWNETGASVAFAVLPYFWETWWFKVGLGGVALAALGITVALAQRRRYRRKLDKVERQREMERERTRIARDLHDDLGTSLTQISMLSALANREQTPATEARELIQQVRGRAREMVTALDEIVWAVNPRNDSLTGLVNYLGHFAEEFYRTTSIRCRLDIPTELPPHPLPAELRHQLFLAFKEALNNVARHAAATEVCIRIGVEPSGLVIKIEDNGRGFENQNGAEVMAGNRGNGLTNMKRRLEQLGGRTELQSSRGVGTTVTFHAPLLPR